MAGTTTNGDKFMLRKDCGDIHRRQISWWISITAIIVSIMLAYGGISYALTVRQSDKISVIDIKVATNDTHIITINQTLAVMQLDILEIKRQISFNTTSLARIETRLDILIEQEAPK